MCRPQDLMPALYPGPLHREPASKLQSCTGGALCQVC